MSISSQFILFILSVLFRMNQYSLRINENVTYCFRMEIDYLIITCIFNLMKMATLTRVRIDDISSLGIILMLSIITQLHCGGHLGGRARLPDTILEKDHPMTIPSKFGSNCATGSRQDGFYVNFP